MCPGAEDITSLYLKYIQKFSHVEEFSMEARSEYAHTIFGAFTQKLKSIIFTEIVSKFLHTRSQYLFQGCRYHEIIETRNKSECMIVGGWSDLYYAFKYGYKFFWVGGVIAAFEIALHTGNYTYLNKVIQVLRKIDIAGDKSSFLFLYEDTQPLGLVLSSVFKESGNVSTVCIAHGFFPESKSNLTFEGNNSNYNFVWDMSQRKFFDEDRTKVIELGLTYDFSLVKKVNRERVVLLGHSGPETNLVEYFSTYSHLLLLYNILKEEGYDVKFKPHPQDDKKYAFKIFKGDIAHDFYKELNNGSIFAGFISSALYEAKVHGAPTVGLDTEHLSYSRAFDVGKSFKISEYKDIHSYLTTLPDEKGRNEDSICISLADRFDSAMSEI